MFETTVSDYIGAYGDHIDKDSVGIEIELESDITPFPTAPAGWNSHVDNSLKSKFSKEYVSKPIKFEDVEKYIHRLQNKLQKSNCNILDSVRPGVHIHLNMLPSTLGQVINTTLTYLAMERTLVKFCGHNREGNLFCLRSSDAKYLLYILGRAIRGPEYFSDLHTDNIRYSSVNLNSIFKHGTLEFRAMRTDPTLNNIEDWVNILHKIKVYGCNMESSKLIPEEISFYGPDLWCKNVLGEDLFKKVNYKGLEDDIIKDMRNIQFLIYR